MYNREVRRRKNNLEKTEERQKDSGYCEIDRR